MIVYTKVRSEMFLSHFKRALDGIALLIITMSIVSGIAIVNFFARDYQERTVSVIEPAIESPALASEEEPAVKSPSTSVEQPEIKTEKKTIEPSKKTNSEPAVLPAVTPEPKPKLPYTFKNDTRDADLSVLGYSLAQLHSQSIHVIGHDGQIPRRCATGASGFTATDGMAIKTTATYAPCPDGQSPLYEAYRPAEYKCVVLYNASSSKKRAILAHEIGHCLHFQYGEGLVFDVGYRKIRDVAGLTRPQVNEIIADDFMICHHGLDTNWGRYSYYARYNMSRPTATQCTQINQLINTYLIK
jgi:hypothetical protein